VQIRVFPVGESAVAIESRAPELDALVFILQEPDFPAQEEMLALFAVPGFVQRPPLFVRVVGLQKLQLSPEGSDQRMGDGVFVMRRWGGHLVRGE
jgi:hypothetical protein